MQEILTNPKTLSSHHHTRLWWMEVVRGGFSIILGLLIFFLTTSILGFFIHLFGVYLLLDGLLDIYKIVTGRRETKRKIIDSLFGIMSIALGLLSFYFLLTTLLLIAAVIAVRIITRGVRVIIDARQSRHKYEGLTWLLGILFTLLGIALLLTTNIQYFTLGLIVFSFSLYAFLDGIYLLIRGLILRFRPSFFAASTAKVPESLLDLPEIFPITTRRAMVVVRRSGANGLGHISWAFEWTNGWFNDGSVENEVSKPVSMPQEMGFWSAHTLNPLETVQKQYLPYDEYKIFYVSQPHPRDAWKTVIWESRQPYTVVHQNCSDVAYDVLRAYGVNEIIDPVEGIVPNDWYDDLPGRSYSIEENPTIPIHLHQISKRDLATKEIMLTIPVHIKGIPPPWRVNGWRIWQELNFTFDKMLRDMHTLFSSIIYYVALAFSSRRK